jgi:hypothetical protein
VRSWLPLLGGNALTNVVETQTLGIVTIEIFLAPASISMQGLKNEGQGIVLTANSLKYGNEVSRINIGANTAAVIAGIPGEPASYSLSDLQFRIVRYLIAPEFHQSLPPY